VAGTDAERPHEWWRTDGDALVESRLRALYHPPEPDPAFVTQLEEELMVAHSVAVPTSGLDWPTTPNGRAVPSPAEWSVPVPSLGPHARRHRWAFAQLATAALLVFTLGITYLALRPGHPATDRLAVLPAMGATPAAPAPGVTAEEELLAVALSPEALPHGDDATFGLVHYTIPAGAAGTWPPPQPAAGCPEAGCLGVDLAYVLEGDLTVTATGPVQVVRSDGRGAAEPIPAGTALTLGPGDATLRPNGTTADYANAGVTPVQLVLGYLTPGGILTYQIPSGWDTHDVGSFSGGQLAEVAGPATLRLRRADLAADAVFAAPPGAAAQVGVAESDSAALGSQSDGALVNVGDQAATVYALALEPSELRHATPAATS
jgi:hypothetical protein